MTRSQVVMNHELPYSSRRRFENSTLICICGPELRVTDGSNQTLSPNAVSRSRSSKPHSSSRSRNVSLRLSDMGMSRSFKPTCAAMPAHPWPSTLTGNGAN